ncbi:uncharacterized protein LOC8069633 [Sorghum bicolor]|uniref:uncharacterized protein LOC8069633 n=1 Tax=Sorghum bicolor TaxID=4558 RepID=UPI000B425A6D|nr:uncharacterized protein LOC8069633 [Sorghum bicolor]|eukprot:XP_002445094.2 uncharacterized protein LOC8069633 [Sorghum bicolor]
MEFFPDGGFVRLQSRQNRKYIHADGDWEGVSLRPLGRVPSLEAVWRVEHWVSSRGHEEGVIFLLFQNAAYGRYLSFSPYRALPGHRGRRSVQVDRNEPPNNLLNAYLWWWRAERVDPNQEYVRLRYADSHFLLRANGRYLTRNNGVTVDRNRRRRGLTTMMQWTVHLVPATPAPLPLPVPEAPRDQPLQIQGGRRGLLFRRRTGNRGPGVYQHPARTIRHVRANEEGEFNQDHTLWSAFASYDHSVFNLRTQLGQLQHDWNGNMLGFTLCMRPGSHGRLMPLVTDLTRSLDTMYIVVFRTGSPGAAALVYPQIDAPVQ